MILPGNPIDSLHSTMCYAHSYIQGGLEDMIKRLESNDATDKDLSTFADNYRAWSRILTMHHRVEEEFLFPILNQTMNFREEKDAHDVIHKKLDGFEATLHEVETDPTKFNPGRIREQLLDLKEPLFDHLDAEVEHLKPEDVRKAGVSEPEVGRALQRMADAFKAAGHH